MRSLWELIGFFFLHDFGQSQAVFDALVLHDLCNMKICIIMSEFAQTRLESNFGSPRSLENFRNPSGLIWRTDSSH